MVDIYEGLIGTKSAIEVEVNKSEAILEEEEVESNKAGLTDTIGPTIKKTFFSSTITGRAIVRQEIIAQQRDIIKKNNLPINLPQAIATQPLISPLRLGPRVGGFRLTEQQLLKREQAQIEASRKQVELIKQLQKERPELGLLTPDEIHEKEIEEHGRLANNVPSDTTFWGKVGYLLGGIIGFTGDPINASTMVLGYAPLKGASFLYNFFRIGLTEGAINGALEGLQKPGEVAIREGLGEEVTAGDIATEVGTAIVGGTLLGGTLGASIAKGIDLTPVLKKKVKILMEGIRAKKIKVTREEKDVAEMIEEVIDIIEQKPDQLTETQHLQEYSKARENISRDQVPGRVDSPIEPEVNTPLDRTAKTTEESLDQQVKSVKERIKEEDFTIPEFDADGQLVPGRSARQVMDDIEAERIEIEATITCLKG